MALPPEIAALVTRRQFVVSSIWSQAEHLAESMWSRLDLGNVLGSWDNALGPTMQRVLGAAQVAASSGAQDYVSATLDAQGVDPAPQGVVSGTSFVGAAADGRDLTSLLRLPAESTVFGIGQGLEPQAAQSRGLTQLKRIVRTEVTDAGRVATGVATVVAQNADGYVRMVAGSACARCILLAGKRYRWNDGFKRHENCQCQHIASAKGSAADLLTDRHEIFNSLTEAEQNKVFTRAGAQAIRDGANFAQVVNARRDMRQVTVAGHQLKTTTVGATRRGLAGSRLGAGRKGRVIRLTPESIYEIAGGDRDETLRLLKVNGYIL